MAVGYSLTKRLSTLKQKSDEHDSLRVGFGRAFFLALMAFSLLCFTASFFTVNSKLSPTASEDDQWRAGLQDRVEEREQWLENSFHPFSEETSEAYFSFAKQVVETVGIDRTNPTPTDTIEDFFHNRKIGLQRFLIGSLLRLGFVVIAFWPLWLLCALAGGGVIFSWIKKKKKRTDDILGICHRGKGPFYSGIYGPLRPNHSISGTDYSCPGLATPNLVPKANVTNHTLIKILQRFGAYNETNESLVRIILAYRDFPCVVEEESPAENTGELKFDGDVFSRPAPSAMNFYSNEEGKLEASALDGLQGILEAHRAVQAIIKKEPAQTLTYKRYASVVSSFDNQLSATGKLLLTSLTVKRAIALAQVAPTVIASAYLAIEAGKSLVYKRSGEKFTRISRFPHLQARAVIHSLVSYHKEYAGDVRLVIRQSIICSRRHGDFGRAFLPITMPPQARALRDLLEIMYAPLKSRNEVAPLVELDAFLEELSVNWRDQFAKLLQSNTDGVVKQANDLDLQTSYGRRYPAGIVYKSVILVPLESVVGTAWHMFDPGQQERIAKLIEITQQSRIGRTITTRLPGFRRQFDAIDDLKNEKNVSHVVAQGKDSAALLKRWAIVRRMLTKYNWLSTRVGDDGVPLDGLIQAVVIDRARIASPEAIGMEALVPIRQRRLKELFGPTWEQRFYRDTPHHRDIDVWVDVESYNDDLNVKRELAKSGRLTHGATESLSSVAGG